MRGWEAQDLVAITFYAVLLVWLYRAIAKRAHESRSKVKSFFLAVAVLFGSLTAALLVTLLIIAITGVESSPLASSFIAGALAVSLIRAWRWVVDRIKMPVSEGVDNVETITSRFNSKQQHWKNSIGEHMNSWLTQKNHRANRKVDKEVEERLYQTVFKELEAGKRREGLWAKALTIAEFDEKKAKAEYVKLRVESLLDEEEDQRQVALEKAKELQASGYMRKEFENWFSTTEFTHHRYDREYTKFILENMPMDNGEKNET